MHKHKSRTLAQLFIACALATALAAVSPGTTTTPAPDKMKPEEVLAKHLEAIGTAEARAKAKSHVILGQAVATFRLGGAGTAEGGSVLASQGTRNLVAIVYGNQEYPYEKVGYDGKMVTVGELKPGVYSTLGKFFKQYEFPLTEGLLGGTLSAAWPLLNLDDRDGVKLKYSGSKKIEGRQMHILEYESKRSGGLKTTLYFDAENFRHVRTEYERRQIQQMPDQPSVTQQQGDAISKLTEDFSDFKEESGLMLPHSYKLQLSIESLKRRTLQDWVFTLTQFNFTRQIEDAEFDVRGTGKKS
jgi:hypothetical protein